MVSDRRIARRYRSLNPVDCHPMMRDRRPLPPLVGRTLDLSVKGALLETRSPIAPHVRLLMLLALAHDYLELEALPVHGHRRVNGRFVTGIRFVKPDLKAVRLIDHFLRAC